MNTIKQLTLRLPIELYEKVRALAHREKRSIHAQILYILEDYLNRQE